MKILLRSTAILSLGLLAHGAMAQDIVRIGTEGAYAPYNFVNDSNQLDGYEIELGNELCKRAELTCEWVQNDWDSIIPNLVSGNYDAIMAGMSITDERKQVIAFSDEYVPVQSSIYASPNGDVDLTSAVISAQAGTIQADYVAASGATLVEFPTFDDALAAAVSGETDAVLADGDSLKPAIEASGGALVAVDAVQIGGGIGVGLRQSDTALQTTFNTAIESMKADGTINALMTKWFGDEAEQF
ncbi:polar amino acid transport system substrate-binding protein [Ketogulonicigenium robustum]|uniref:Polar amino acid transport system substrate-binding protein n=1 Tax=Ketogulonicigenium robustum TaxID=92947 RepID=A0A1W6NXD3_9RHOB|nr:transporter substrate-binding domain-containing protein [Ketogulonicigenium robustum]ARO13905.1 polar amino acid transport system substrate-binding protein [Ketogulonicigenium robustum]